MKHAVFPGSFDPVTLGHIDIIHRIAKQFDKITVLVADSSSKNYLFTSTERVQLIKEALNKDSIKVEKYEGLTVNYLKKVNAHCIVRGVRGGSDFEYEMAMAKVNKKLAFDIETLMLVSNPNLDSISSSGVKEIAKLNGELTGFIPANVIKALKDKLGV